jgi:hypothetical protein
MLIMIYVLLTIFTWLYSGYKSGQELAEIKHRIEKGEMQPQYIQVNYVNVFFQGLCWPTYWMVFIGQWVFDKNVRIKGPKIVETKFGKGK